MTVAACDNCSECCGGQVWPMMQSSATIVTAIDGYSSERNLADPEDPAIATLSNDVDGRRYAQFGP